MIAFAFLPARHGDCILVTWGAAGRLMVVDGGPDGVYEQVLRPRLMAMAPGPGAAPRVDLLCLSHVDDDHAVGVIRLLGELVRAKRDQLPAPIDLRRVWFNSVDELIDREQPGLAQSVQAIARAVAPAGVVAASYGQGRAVRDSIAALKLSGNPPFNQPLTAGMTTQLDGLDVTLLGPTDKAVAKLVATWQASVKQKDPKPVGAAYVDRSVPNLSSIALHLQAAGRTALLTGDCRGDHLLAGLEATKLLAPGGQLHVDVFKLPHHGSGNNAEPALFQRIRADHYVICADGIKHQHPSPATLDWLVHSRDHHESFTIHLTNPIPAAEAHLKALSAGRSFEVAVGAPGVSIDFS